MTIYSGQWWLFYFEIASMRLGGQTHFKDFLISFLVMRFSFIFGTWITLFQPTFFKLLVICVHASLGFIVHFSFISFLHVHVAIKRTCCRKIQKLNNHNGNRKPC
jgi:hypothetical protein